MRQKQLIVYLLLLLLVIGLFSILLLPDEEETLPHVVFAEMKSPVAGPLALAHLKGYYAEEGLDVEVQSFSIARKVFFGIGKRLKIPSERLKYPRK